MITAAVRYTPKHFRALMKAQDNPSDRNMTVIFLAVTVLYVIGVLCGIFTFSKLIALILLVNLCRLLGARLILPKISAVRQNRQFPPPIYFCWTDDSFETHIADEITQYPYSELTAASFFGGYFTIFVTKRGGFAVGAHELTEGTPEQLAQLLKAKLGDAFTYRA